MRSKYKSLGLLLIAGLLVRFWAMRWPPFLIDMNDWIAWGERVLAVGPRHFYSETVFSDYTPGYIYVMWLTAWIKQTFFATASVETYYFLYRLPSILFDLGTTTLIYITVEQALEKRFAQPGGPTKKRKKEKQNQSQARDYGPLVPVLAAACFLFNPAVIFNSATWGQLDASFTFLLFLSLFLLLRGRPEFAIIAYMLAFIVKPQSISLAPLIAVVLLTRYRPLEWAKFSAIGIVVTFIVLFPFFGISAFPRLFALLSKSVETYPYATLYMYNVWSLFYNFWVSDTTPFILGISARRLSLLLYIAGIVAGVALLVRQLRKTSDQRTTLFFFATYFTFLPVMVLTRMHERYIYPLLPFLVTFAFLYQIQRQPQRKWKLGAFFLNTPFVVYLIVTVLHAMAIYYVYLYYNHLLNKTSVDQSNIVFYLIEGHVQVWSVIMLTTFLIVTLNVLKWSSLKKAPG